MAKRLVEAHGIAAGQVAVDAPPRAAIPPARGGRHRIAGRRAAHGVIPLGGVLKVADFLGVSHLLHMTSLAHPGVETACP